MFLVPTNLNIFQLSGKYLVPKLYMYNISCVIHVTRPRKLKILTFFILAFIIFLYAIIPDCLLLYCFSFRFGNACIQRFRNGHVFHDRS